MHDLEFKITNLDCPSCVALSNDALRDIPGVVDSQVDFKSGLAKVTAEREIFLAEIKEALETVDKQAVEL